MTIQPTQAGFKVDPSRGSHDGAVSMQWFSRPRDERFLSLSDMLATYKSQWSRSEQLRLSNRDFELVTPEIETKQDFHKLGFEAGKSGNSVLLGGTLSHWAFNQISQLSGAPASYMRQLPSPLVADCVNYGLHHRRDVEHVKLFAEHMESGVTILKAATGPDYGRVPNFEVIEAIANAIEGTTWKIPGRLDWSTNVYNPYAPVTIDSTTLYGNDRSIFVFLVDDTRPIEIGKLPDGSPDLVFRGFYVEGCETGAASMKLRCFYLRAVCMNRNLWGVEGVEEVIIRHTLRAPDRWVNEMMPSLRAYTEASGTKLIEGVNIAKAAKVANDDEEAVAFLKARNFSASRAKAILDVHEKEEGRPARSAWDMAQGITAFARNQANVDDRLEIEVVAGRILDKVA